MPNDNALKGIHCPKCLQAGEFRIQAHAMFDVTDDGTGDYTNVEWTENSLIECTTCNATGTVKSFTAKA